MPYHTILITEDSDAIQNLWNGPCELLTVDTIRRPNNSSAVIRVYDSLLTDTDTIPTTARKVGFFSVLDNSRRGSLNLQFECKTGLSIQHNIPDAAVDEVFVKFWTPV